ncbi:MAG: helix-turn-helix transcriptional regulator [Elusimicrobiales bacterium]|jgi:DNA-binding transcriptional regulator YiaG|nr:helix-turn-helix transcriptional regulator [Elusimicrobiales bacterium]
MKNINISKLIKELRNKLDLTQEQFAQRVGVTFSTVNSWESGSRKPHPFLLNRLLEMAEEVGLKNIENVERIKK